MTTLPDIRDRVRSDLRDLDADAARWSDAELDRHISRALADVSLAAPAEATTIVTYAIDRLTAGDDVAERFRLWGEGRLRTFREQLREHQRPRRVRGGRLAATD